MATVDATRYHPRMPKSIFLIILATLLFALLHSLMAMQRLKRHCYARNISSQHYRLFYVASAILLTGAWLMFIDTLPDAPLYQLRGAARIIAVTLQGIALVIIWLSFRPIDLAVFLGLRPFPNGNEPFHESGIYRYLRHPMYSGVILLLAVAPQQSVNHMTVAVAVTVYLIIGSRFEEQRLLAAHPAYADYRRRVPAFIPRPLRLAGTSH